MEIWEPKPPRTLWATPGLLGDLFVTFIIQIILTYLLNYLRTYLLNYLRTYLLNYFTEQSPSSEFNRFSVSQETPRILWKPRVHYHSHQCPPPVLILSQLDPVHVSTSRFLKIHLNTTLPCTPGFPKCSLFFMFPHQNPVYSSRSYVLHTSPISFFSILSPEQY